ncbi:MAG: UDP-N-acetylmuramate:L-alanyl-gamma-D-glutamyl-meso-diaminopimelate ligase [Lysobacterales bacterium]
MKLHILGICGTFMGGLAALARELGEVVEGSDQQVYPPMSEQLTALGIGLCDGYRGEHLAADTDLVIVGNATSRGNPAVEHMLNARMAYTSGPQWLSERVLPGRRVLAVAGTHGKTTTSSLLAWLLEAGGQQPGFLVGGIPANFGCSARLGGGAAFVVEADEYDTAFFDKRSKFVHYRPEVAILNNLEFDHADIFDNVAAIQKQFHHLVRTLPGNGRLIVNGEDPRLTEVLAMGCWTPVERFAIAGGDAGDAVEWQARLLAADGSRFELWRRGRRVGIAEWSQIGRHSVMNALAAIAAAEAVGVSAERSLAALKDFQSPKRRLEIVARADDIVVYDDFAHHPTAIATTLAGLRASVGAARLIVALEPRSNSMRQGAHAEQLAPALANANQVVLLQRPELPWDAGRVIAALAGRGQTAASVDALLLQLQAMVRPGDQVIFMSNGSFEAAPRRFGDWLAARPG